VRQTVRFNHLPRGIDDSQLEDTLGKINGNSSIHFGLLSLKTDPHRLRQFGAKKTGESIPSFYQACAKSRAGQ
jgi:hypothetical protein